MFLVVVRFPEFTCKLGTIIKFYGIKKISFWKYLKVFWKTPEINWIEGFVKLSWNPKQIIFKSTQAFWNSAQKCDLIAICYWSGWCKDF